MGEKGSIIVLNLGYIMVHGNNMDFLNKKHCTIII